MPSYMGQGRGSSVFSADDPWAAESARDSRGGRRGGKRSNAGANGGGKKRANSDGNGGKGQGGFNKDGIPKPPGQGKQQGGKGV